MAYVFQTLEDEEKKKEEGQPGMPAAGAPSVIGGEGQAATNVGPASSGIGFTDLRKYLAANQENIQSTTKKIADDLRGRGDTVRGNIDKVVGGYEQSVDQGQMAGDDDLINRAATDPAGFVKNADDVNRFRSIRDARYTGPTGAFDQSDEHAGVVAEINALEPLAKSTETESGRTGLMRNLYPGMGQGKITLNQALMTASPDSHKALSEAVKPFAGLRDYLDKKTTAANQKAQEAKIKTEALPSKARAPFEGEGKIVEGHKKGIQDKIIQAENSRVTKNTAIQNLRDFIEGRADRSVLTPEQEAMFVSPDYWGPRPDPIGWVRDNRLEGDDWMAQYFPGTKTQDVAALPSNVASAEDFAREAALEQLMGYDIPGLDATDTSAAGTYPGDPTIGYFQNPGFGTVTPTPGPIDGGTTTPPPGVPISETETTKTVMTYDQNGNPTGQTATIPKARVMLPFAQPNIIGYDEDGNPIYNA